MPRFWRRGCRLYTANGPSNDVAVIDAETLEIITTIDVGETPRGIAELEQVAAGCRSAFMCAEKVPWQCQHRFIAEALVERRWKVRHILDDETVWDPEELLLT